MPPKSDEDKVDIDLDWNRAYMPRPSQAMFAEFHSTGPAALAKYCPLDNDLHGDIYSRESTPSLGNFDALPEEVLQSVFLNLDVLSLTTCRAVNTAMRKRINGLREYQVIYKHAPRTLRMALSIQVAHNITLQQLYSALYSHNCVSCPSYSHQFGGFLYLPTCSRICYDCMLSKDDYFPVPPVDARLHYGLTRKRAHVEGLVMGLSLPGSYATGMNKRRKRILLVDRSSAQSKAIEVHGSLEQFEAYTASILKTKRVSHEEMLARCGKKERDQLRPLDSILTLPPDEDPEANALRFMFTIRVPWFNSRNGEISWGRKCKACCKVIDVRYYKRETRQLYSNYFFPVHEEFCDHWERFQNYWPKEAARVGEFE